MSGNSSGERLEDGDQRNAPASEVRQEQKEQRYDEGKEQSHQGNDPKDERSIANRLAAAEKHDDTNESGKNLTAEQIAGQEDPTAPARMHGNEPSRGAKIDKRIEDEEAEIIRKMDEKKAQKNAN